MRRFFYIIMVLILYSLLNASCDFAESVYIKNCSKDSLWILSGYTTSEYGDNHLNLRCNCHERGGTFKVVPPDSSSKCLISEVNTTFDYIIESHGPLHIFIYNKDTLVFYGVDALDNNKYLVEYVINSSKIAATTYKEKEELRYPPTKEMIDAGVKVFYPDDTSPSPNHLESRR